MDKKIAFADAFRLTTAFLAATVALMLLWEIGDFFMVILTAIIFAMVMAWPTEALVKRKVPRFLAALFSHTAIFGAAIFIFYLMLPALIFEVRNLAGNYSGYWAEFLNYVGSGRFVLSSYLETVIGALTGNFRDAVGIIFGIFGSFLSFVLVFFVSLVANIQKGGVKSLIILLAPQKRHARAEAVYEKIQQRVNRWIWGRTVCALLVGVSVFVGLSIIGVPNAAILAVLAFLLDFIIYVGPTVAAIPAVILSLTLSPWHAVATVCLYVFIGGVLETFIFNPLLMKEAVHVSPAVIILLVALGGALGGPLGVIIAVPTAAIAQVFLEESLS